MPGRVLIVDDIAHNIKLLETKLSAEYYDVIAASSGMEALKLAQEQLPDIILLDVMMPEMDGFETCAKLKGNAVTQHIPVIMVTALSDTRDKVRGLEAGADEFISKPIRDLPLFARVRALVRLKTLMDAWRVREETSADLGLFEKSYISEETMKGVDIAFLTEEKVLVQRLQEALEQDQHTIHAFDTLESFCHALQKNHYDIAVSTLYVGGKDVLMPCSQIRVKEKNRNIPILLVAEEADEPLLLKALEIGINDYIMRPIDSFELRARVRTQIRRLRYQQSLKENFEKSISLALTDDLTKLYNRRYFNAHLDSLLQQSAEQQKSVVLLVIDIDKFKTINDTYGHDEGDKILADVAARLTQGVRDSDLIARLGGEEFVVVMPDARTGVGLQVAERLRNFMESYPFLLLSGQEVLVTVSVGLACSNAVKGIGRASLLKAADEALYKAKRSGRNRVVVGNIQRKLRGTV
jgi:two-component system cell cycle response regulator